MLVFVGVKMLVTDLYHVPIAASLGVIALILTVSIVASLRRGGKEPRPDAAAQVKQMNR